MGKGMHAYQHITGVQYKLQGAIFNIIWQIPESIWQSRLYRWFGNLSS